MTNLEVKFMETASSFFTRKVNWEQVKIDASIAAMQAFIMRGGDSEYVTAMKAEEYAQALVNRLKKEKS